MKRRDWKTLCENEGFDFVKIEGLYVHFRFDGFEFKSTKIEFPPKHINPSKCLDKTNYAVFKFHLKHGDKYDYSKFEYVSNSQKETIICRKHGEFQMSYNTHQSGHGCKSCGVESRSEINTGRVVIPKCEWISRFKEVHGDRYDYSKVVLSGSVKDVEIVCGEHGSFYQKPYVHARGSLCPHCSCKSDIYSRSGYIEACPDGSNIYIFEIEGFGERFIKIGISKNPEARMLAVVREAGYSVRIKNYFFNSDAGVIWDIEKYLHNLYFNFRYKPNVDFKGWSECFCNLEVVNIEREILGKLEVM